MQQMQVQMLYRKSCVNKNKILNFDFVVVISTILFVENNYYPEQLLFFVMSNRVIYKTGDPEVDQANFEKFLAEIHQDDITNATIFDPQNLTAETNTQGGVENFKVLSLNPDALCKGFGMSYNMSEEESIMRNIKKMTPVQISIYADEICMQTALNSEFLKRHFNISSTALHELEEEIEKNPNKVLNPTTLGNLAYIIVHSPEPYNKVAQEQFDFLMKYIS